MFRALLYSSSGGQNCIIQHLVSSHSVGDRPVHRTATYSVCLPTVIISHFESSAFSPRRVIICTSLMILRTQMVSLYSPNRPVSVMETQCVYCVVRAKLLNVI